MRLRRPSWRTLGAALLLAAVLAPGWRGRFVPVAHDEALEAAGRARAQTGVTRRGSLPGEEWHLQYLDSWTARMLDELGLRGAAPSLAPPDYAAHIPPGAKRADGYFRTETEVHWPWWRPGGGVAWEAPLR